MDKTDISFTQSRIPRMQEKETLLKRGYPTKEYTIRYTVSHITWNFFDVTVQLYERCWITNVLLYECDYLGYDRCAYPSLNSMELVGILQEMATQVVEEYTHQHIVGDLF